jgi:hypothetical protein
MSTLLCELLTLRIGQGHGLVRQTSGKQRRFESKGQEHLRMYVPVLDRLGAADMSAPPYLLYFRCAQLNGDHR